MPRTKIWIQIATFSEQELLDKFISEKFVSIQRHYTLKTCKKVSYGCRSKAKFGCRYELCVQLPGGNSDEFVVYESSEHVHKDYKRSLPMNLRKIVDPAVEAGMSTKEIRRMLHEQHPLPVHHVLSNYVTRKRAKTADDPIPPSPCLISSLCRCLQTESTSYDSSESSKLGLTVTCGSLKGRLMLDKFFCPGIHVPCIQISAHVMLTPKQFTVEAGCEKNGQWALVILYENQSLSEMMDQGSVDFFDHANRCSAICNSPIPSMRRVRKSLIAEASSSSKSARLILPRNKIHAKELEVTCNGLKGTLIMSEFICPGLHERCIASEDGELITPKDFVVKGTNDRMMYKDEKTNEWRTMIQYKGVSLSHYIERKELDFYNHGGFCTQYCKRKPRGNLETERISESSVAESGEDISSDSEDSQTLDPEDQDSLPSFVVQDNNDVELKIEPHDEYSAAIEIEDNKNMVQNNLPIFKDPANFYLQGDNDIEEKIEPNNEHSVAIEIEDNIDHTVQDNLPIFKDPANFWKRIIELGLIDEFFKDILIQCKMTLFNPDIESNPQVSLEVCHQLSSTVRSLGLTNCLMIKLKDQQDKSRNSAPKLQGEAEAINPVDQKTLRSQFVLAEQLLPSNSSNFAASVFDYISEPLLKQPKIENATESFL